MPPVNDNLANARVITADVSYNDTTIGATNEGSPSTPGDEAYDYDDVAVWYRLEWGATGKWRVRVTNADTGYNAPNKTHLGYGSRIYNPTTDPPANIGQLSEVFEDTPRGTFVGSGDELGVFSLDDTAQTPEHGAGTVRYIRFGASQSSGFPYYTWTGNYTISFEFITPPYNPGSPPGNDDMSTATVLSIPGAAIAGTTVAAPNNSVWYRWEPAEDVVITVTIHTDDADWTPYGDMYHLDGANDPPLSYADLSNDGWYTWLGDVDITIPGYPKTAYASFALQGGEVYLMEVYDRQNIFNAAFTIKTETGKEPSNDRMENAQVISPSVNWPQVIHGTTLYGSQDRDEVINWDGSQTPSVWYLLDNQGPGAMSFIIESDPRPDASDPRVAGPIPMEAQLFYKTADHTQAGVVDISDLTEDGSQTYADTHLGYLDLSRYGSFYGFETNSPASSAYAWDPLVGGEKFYLRVSAYNYNGQYDASNFKLTVFVAPPQVCLNAVDYINGSSSSASIVSGKVRESQLIDMDGGGISPYPKVGYEGWMDTQTATLIIPGEDIADAPGLYAVQMKYLNAVHSYTWVAGFRRNGQPFEPGAELSDAAGGAYTDWLTMMAGAPHPNELDMARFLPVQPGDTIEIVVAYNAYSSTETIDIDQVCFQKMHAAIEAPAYAHLTIPDWPLGTTSSDMGTTDQQGDLILYKDDAPTFATHRDTAGDLVVTDDGTLYCLSAWSCGGFGSPRIGPVLQKWTGSAWSVVNDDIGGFGVKRAGSDINNGFTMSMDTDGEDIWVCYNVDGGVNGPGTAHSVHIKVRKYDVSANSWSDVGSPFHGSRSDVGGATAAEYAVAVSGDAGETPIIRVSPGGVPWVVFTDAYCPDNGHEADFAFWQMRHYVARWTGSTWDVDVLPGPYESDDDYTLHVQSSGGGTSYLGVTCDEITQTSPTTDNITVTPPAGKWCFKYRYAVDRVSGTSGVGVRFYKNGVLWAGETWGTPGSLGAQSTDIAWTRTGFFHSYVDCNGSDTISIRMWSEGTGTRHVYLDYIAYMDAHRVEENVGFGFNARFTDDGQPQGMLYMHQVGDTDYGENPGVLYMCSYTRPFLSNAERDAATPPLGWDSMEILDSVTGGHMVLPEQTTGNYLWNWQTWIYAEWDGSQWVKKWNQLIEEGGRNHVYVTTLYDGISSSPPVGHYQQGFGGCTDGKKNYMTANLGGGQAFGFFGDTIVALAIGPDGFEPFTDGPPGALQGPGYPQGVVFGLAGFNGWGWDTGGRSIHADVNGNVWLAFNGTEGATFNYSEFIAVAANDQMTPQLAGMSGWYAAADSNESLGQDNTYMTVGHAVTSPSGDKLYVLFDAYLWSDGSGGSPDTYTYGVYECPIDQNVHIPLIPQFIVGIVSFSGVREIEGQHHTMQV